MPYILTNKIFDAFIVLNLETNYCYCYSTKFCGAESIESDGGLATIRKENDSAVKLSFTVTAWDDGIGTGKDQAERRHVVLAYFKVLCD